jgi:hypothetical protein
MIIYNKEVIPTSYANQVLRKVAIYKEDDIIGDKAILKDSVLKNCSISDQLNAIRKYLIDPTEENLNILKNQDEIINKIVGGNNGSK